MRFSDASTADAIDPRTLTLRLDELLPIERTTAVDAGRFMSDALTDLRIWEPRALLSTLGFAPIGLGVAMALGAGFARPERPSVALVGDGGFMLGGMSDFQTAVRENVELIVVVFNDGAYGAEHSKLLRDNLDPSITQFDWPDFADVARSLGGQGLTVTNRDDLEEAFRPGRMRPGPVLLDCHIDPMVAAQAPA